MSAGYETFFGLSERPFSLTSDPRYFFRSRAHGRALETLTFGLRSRVRFLSLTGDLGIGKTMFCRTLCDQIRRTVPVVYVGNPLLSPDAFERLLMEDLALSTFEALDAMTDDAVIVVDEAHSLPDQLLSHLLSLSRRHIDNEYLFRFVFVGQPMFGDPSRLGIAEIDDRVSTRVRLLPLGREECTAYIEHRHSLLYTHARLRVLVVGWRTASGQPAVRARVAGSRRARDVNHRAAHGRRSRSCARVVMRAPAPLPLVQQTPAMRRGA
jgi:general secretion pathway protein A